MTHQASDNLLFRMQHIVPRDLLSSAPNFNDQQQASGVPGKSVQHEPEEVAFPMTFGNIAAKVWGPPNGRPVIAVHGWLDNAGTFDALIPLLPNDLRIVAVDIAGHGLSAHFPPDIAYNYYDSILAIERVSRHLGWNTFSFLGHSMGATMGMLYCGIYPEKVDKFVSIDVVRAIVTIPETVNLRLRKTADKLLNLEKNVIAGPEKPMSYEEAVQRGIKGSFGSLNEKACHHLYKRGLKKVDGGYVLSRDRRLMAAPFSLQPQEEMLALAGKVTAQVLIIKFGESPMFEPLEKIMEHIEALKTKSKNVQYVELPVGKHHAHLTEPELIAPLISNFLNA